MEALASSRAALGAWGVDFDPFAVLGLEPGCDFAAITAAHAERCRHDPADRERYDRALLELLGAVPAAAPTAFPSVKAPAVELTADVPEVLPVPAGDPGQTGRAPVPEETPRESAADEHCRRGNRFRQQGDFERALDEYRRALRHDPRHYATYANRGRLLAEHFNDAAQALKDFTTLVRLAPQSAEAYFLRGKLLAIRLGQSDQALSDFEAASTLKPDWAEPFYQCGLLHEARNEPKKALADYTRALEREVRHAGAASRRARLWTELGDRQKAIQDYDLALELVPDSVELLVERGCLLQQMNRLPEALADFKRAIQLAPRLAQAYYNRGKLLIQMGQPNQAQADFDRAIELASP